MRILVFILLSHIAFSQVSPSKFAARNISVSTDFTITQLTDFPGAGRDSARGDSTAGYFWMFGGVKGEPQTGINSIWRFDGTVWDSVGLLPSKLHDLTEPIIRRIGSRIYILKCENDTLYKFNPYTLAFTNVASGVSFMTSECYASYGVTDDNRILITGGNASPGGFSDDAYLIDTLGNWRKVLEPTPFGTGYGYGAGAMSSFQGDLVAFGGGITYDNFANHYWTVSDTGITWADKGIKLIVGLWSSSAAVSDVLYLCCGFAGGVDMSELFYTQNHSEWYEISVTWSVRHAGLMFPFGDAVYFVTGRSTGGAYPKEFWKIELN